MQFFRSATSGDAHVNEKTTDTESTKSSKPWCKFIQHSAAATLAPRQGVAALFDDPDDELCFG